MKMQAYMEQVKKSPVLSSQFSVLRLELLVLIIQCSRHSMNSFLLRPENRELRTK
jgi:hypothetical protein